MIRSRWLHRRPVGVPLLVVAVATVGLAQLQDTAARAEISQFARWSRTTKWGTTSSAVTLRTWGYIDDRCIAAARLDGCFTSSTWTTLRPETTAQTLAIHALIGLGHSLDTKKGKGKIDWEVGPPSSSDTNAARLPPLEPAGEPDDP